MRPPMHSRLSLSLFAALALLALTAQASFAQAKKTATVLLYDGKLPVQVELESAARKAFAPHQAKVDLQTMHAGRAETVPFLRRHGLSRKDAPVLLVLDEAGPRARIVRRIPLVPEGEIFENVRVMLAALRLPVPRREKLPEPGSEIFSVRADGGAAEKDALFSEAGPQRIESGARQLDPGGVAVYRVPVPAGLRKADLRVEIGGSYVVEAGAAPAGPWTVVMDSHRYFGDLGETLTGRLQPVADLSQALEHLRADLYLRVRTGGGDRAELARIEVFAVGQGEVSGEVQWLSAAEKLRRERQAVVTGNATGTPLAGTVSDDLTLRAERSPYLMTGDVIVPPGKTLTVEPGVTVLVGGRYLLRVQGQLVARGTAEKPIVFKPAKAVDADDWKGIEFVPMPGLSSGSKSLLEFCRFVNSANLDLNRFGGEVAGCTFENSLTGVTLRDGGSGRIHHNRFLKCRRGMLLAGGAGEVTYNEWNGCLVAIAATEPHPRLELKVQRNSVLESAFSAVSYPRHPARVLPALALPQNHWGGVPAERLIGPASAEVILEPRLDAAPKGIGPEGKPPRQQVVEKKAEPQPAPAAAPVPEPIVRPGRAFKK